MRRNLTSLLPLAAAALVLAGGQTARASILLTLTDHPACENVGSGNGCAAQSSYVTGDGSGGTIHIIDFNSSTSIATDPNGIATYSGSYGINGASAPLNDTTNYLNLNGTATITFSVAIDYFGFQWGSGDGYNEVHFYDGAVDAGDFVGGSADHYASFNATGGTTFNKVVLISSGCCFETDNHAYVIAGDHAAPEPGTLGTAGTLLAVLPGYMMWRRRSRKQNAR